MTDVRELRWVQKAGTEGERVWVCSDACQGEVESAMAMVQRGMPVFVAALVALFVTVALGGILSVILDERMSGITGLGMAAFGLVIAKYPLVTPQTVLMFGMKRGFAVGRIAGLVFALTGVVIGGTAFI